MNWAKIWMDLFGTTGILGRNGRGYADRAFDERGVLEYETEKGQRRSRHVNFSVLVTGLFYCDGRLWRRCRTNRSVPQWMKWNCLSSGKAV